MKITMLFLGISAILLNACGVKDKKSEKGSWTQSERKEFMRNCISSAKRTYEQRGQQPDSAVITCMCKFSGSKIEEQYSYQDADKIAPGEIKVIMEGAAKKCLVK